MGLTERWVTPGVQQPLGRRARRVHGEGAMALWRTAIIALALELVMQCALVEAQATNFASAGRQSYTQPDSQGGVLTGTVDGPPYRDANDAVRSAVPPFLVAAALSLPIGVAPVLVPEADTPMGGFKLLHPRRVICHVLYVQPREWQAQVVSREC